MRNERAPTLFRLEVHERVVIDLRCVFHIQISFNKVILVILVSLNVIHLLFIFCIFPNAQNV